MTRHEIDGIRRRELCRDNKITFILPIIGIDQDEHPAIARILDNVLDWRERCIAGHASSLSPASGVRRIAP